MSLAYSKTHKLDRRFSVEFALDNGQLEARWSPHVPKGRKARNLIPAYRDARNSFLASLDVPVLVVEG